MTTALKPDELLLDVRIPLLPVGVRFGFYEFSRRAGDFAMAMALTVWEPAGGMMKNVRFGAGGCEPKARRLAEVERFLAGSEADAAAFAAAGDLAAQALNDVMEDARTPAPFRRQLMRTVASRALERSAA
jgi:carbon-monoxide dehydrogenase medium subunit